MTVYFKYEKVGNFYFVCGVLGHTEAFCPKKVEPGYVEGEKGRGHYLRADLGGSGSSATTNRWMRDGMHHIKKNRMQDPFFMKD